MPFPRVTSTYFPVRICLYFGPLGWRISLLFLYGVTSAHVLVTVICGFQNSNRSYVHSGLPLRSLFSCPMYITCQLSRNKTWYQEKVMPCLGRKYNKNCLTTVIREKRIFSSFIKELYGLTVSRGWATCLERLFSLFFWMQVHLLFTLRGLCGVFAVFMDFTARHNPVLCVHHMALVCSVGFKYHYLWCWIIFIR